MAEAAGMIDPVESWPHLLIVAAENPRKFD
jgi:hypothetical protein